MGEVVSVTLSDSALLESSPSVQAHLGILQGVIQRMSANSSSCKTWCITVVSAVLVIVTDKNTPNAAFIALIPTLLFLALDVYYLALEKGFRASYGCFVKKVHAGSARAEDLYEVAPMGSHFRSRLEALGSFSIWGFYGTLFILIEFARRLLFK
jgi:hypothetical protein